MAGQMARTYRLDGPPKGAWTGTGRVLGWGPQPVSADEHEVTRTELLTLVGEGAYEGLFAALVRVIQAGNIVPYEGFIFEGELPLFPDPIEPTSE